MTSAPSICLLAVVAVARSGCMEFDFDFSGLDFSWLDPSVRFPVCDTANAPCVAADETDAGSGTCVIHANASLGTCATPCLPGESHPLDSVTACVGWNGTALDPLASTTLRVPLATYPHDSVQWSTVAVAYEGATLDLLVPLDPQGP